MSKTKNAIAFKDMWLIAFTKEGCVKLKGNTEMIWENTSALAITDPVKADLAAKILNLLIDEPEKK